MDEERAELIALACNEFVFSLEGIGAAFERVRHFPWNKVERHLEMLVAARRRLAGSKLKILPLADLSLLHDNLDDLLAILDRVDKGVHWVQYRLFNPVTGEQTSQSLVHHAAAANRVFVQIRGEAARRGINVERHPIGPMTPLSPMTGGREGGGKRGREGGGGGWSVSPGIWSRSIR